MARSNLPPKLQACFLYERTDSKGRTYWKGRMGGLSVLVAPNEQDNSDSAPYVLQFAAPLLVALAPGDAD